MMNTEELEYFNMFMQQHKQSCGYPTFCLSTQNTSIGMLVIVQCDECEEIRDISDYASW